MRLKKKPKKTYIVKLGTVAEHEADVGDELLGRTVEVAAPLAELGSDHGQVNGPFDDLVVVTSLQARERELATQEYFRLYTTKPRQVTC